MTRWCPSASLVRNGCLGTSVVVDQFCQGLCQGLGWLLEFTSWCFWGRSVLTALSLMKLR